MNTETTVESPEKENTKDPNSSEAPKDKKEKISTLYERIEIVPGMELFVCMKKAISNLLSAETQSLIESCLEDLVLKVSRGEDWLSKEQPNWIQMIKPDEFYLGSSNYCVLSQAFLLPFGMVLEGKKLSLQSAVDYGFHPGDPISLTDPKSRALTILWLVVVKFRLPPKVS